MHELKEEMIKVLGNRKQAVLPTAIKIFNKLQEKYVSSSSLDDYGAREESVDHSTGLAQDGDKIKDIN